MLDGRGCISEISAGKYAITQGLQVGVGKEGIYNQRSIFIAQECA